MHNFTGYCQKEGDFLKYYRANWPCKQVAFFHGWTVKGAESNTFTCKPRSILKTLGLIRSHTRTMKAANFKAFMCKLRDKATDSKGIITSVTEAMRMNSVLPAVLFLAMLNRLAARQAWLLRKIPPSIPGISILRFQLTGLARLSYNHKLDFCYV